MFSANYQHSLPQYLVTVENILNLKDHTSRMDCFQSRSKWCYRGEGNATLVISNPETQEVLRLRKVPVKAKEAAEPVDDRSHETTRKYELTRNVDFCKEIFVPLLSERYVHPGVVVDLPEDFTTRMNHLTTSANGERPFHRLIKEVSANCKLGVLVPDFCFISNCHQSDFTRSKPSPTFCVEIKPKCGILPTYADCDVQSSVYNEVKRSICKFCLLQWQKVNKEGRYPQRSEYCPIDLFSMDAKRVLYALKCLLKDPQNNLRIFRDGKLVYSGERNLHVPSQSSLASAGNTSPVNKTPPSNGTCMVHNMKLLELEDVLKSSFITDCNEAVLVGNLFSEIGGTTFNYTTIFMVTLLQLLVDDSKKFTIDANHLASKTPVCAESNYNDSTLLKNDDLQSFLMSSEVSFCKGGVLNKILNAQRLDKLGSDEVFKFYKDVCNNGNTANILQTNNFTLNHVGVSEDDVVTKHVALKYFDENLPQPKSSQTSSEEESSISCKLGNMARFLVAASANDCSVMISFQQVDEAPTDSTCYFKEAITGVYYKYSIAAVDLDPKNISRIPKYYRDYHEIIENYLFFSKNIL